MERLERGTTRIWKMVLVCLALAAALGVLWLAAFNPITGVAPDRDSGIFLYVGQQLLRGQTLYTDLFDVKGPLVYLANAAGLWLAGGSMWGVYLLGLALLAAGVLLVFFAFLHRFGFGIATVAAVYCALLMGVFAQGNAGEGYVNLTQLAALYLVTRWAGEDSPPAPYVVLGLVGALAFFTKMTGIGFWVALIVAETVLAAQTRCWRVYARRLLSLLCGAVAGSVVLVAYLLVSGGLGAFAYVYFSFNAAYASQHDLGERLDSLVQGVQRLGYLPVACFAVMWLILLWMTVARARRGERADYLVVLALVWLPLEFLIATYAGRGSRYYLTALPALVLVFVLGCREAFPEGRLRHLRSRGIGLALGVLLLGAVAGLLPAVGQDLRNLAGSVLHYREYVKEKPNAVYAGSSYPYVSDFVRGHTRQGDFVLVWGDYSQATNFFADRLSPTRYVFQPFLYNQSYGDGLVSRFLSDLKAHPPVMILDSSPSSAPLLERPSIAAVETGEWPGGDARGYKAAWEAVGAYFRDHYRLVRALPAAPYWKVYVRS